MKRSFVVAVGIAVCVLSAGLVCAADRWENGLFADDDSAAATFNGLRHGVLQAGHDLEGVGDQDWMMALAQVRHSYEAVVSSGTVAWGQGIPGTCINCPVFDRVDSTGAVLTAGVPEGPQNATYSSLSRVRVRWIAVANGTEFLRVIGDTVNNLSATNQYDVEFYDTTYFLPRFNNSSTQITVFVVQNTTPSAVSGNIYFYDTSGNLLNTQALSLPAQGLLTLNTATILPGQGGSAAIAQTGGYGALAGKAVAVEPATGFTFDTALTPAPR